MEKNGGGAHSQTVPNYICLCSQICTYSNAAINEALFHIWVDIEIVRVDPVQNKSWQLAESLSLIH